MIIDLLQALQKNAKSEAVVTDFCKNNFYRLVTL
jgi:hypothetical protein